MNEWRKAEDSSNLATIVSVLAGIKEVLYFILISIWVITAGIVWLLFFRPPH